MIFFTDFSLRESYRIRFASRTRGMLATNDYFTNDL